jgi:hypothetical protein
LQPGLLRKQHDTGRGFFKDLMRGFHVANYSLINTLPIILSFPAYHFGENSPGPIYRFCGAALAIVRFAAFPETICATQYGNCWQTDFSQFRIYVIFNGNGRPKKNGPSRFEEGPCGFEPTTLEGIIGKLRV